MFAVHKLLDQRSSTGGRATAWVEKFDWLGGGHATTEPAEQKGLDWIFSETDVKLVTVSGGGQGAEECAKRPVGLAFNRMQPCEGAGPACTDKTDHPGSVFHGHMHVRSRPKRPRDIGAASV